MRIGPQAKVCGCNPAFRINRSGFDKDYARSSDCSAGEVDKLPIIGKPVRVAVLAHGRDSDPVGKRDRTLRERREEVIGSDCHHSLDVRRVEQGSASGHSKPDPRE